jgi:hypothetical protein
MQEKRTMKRSFIIILSFIALNCFGQEWKSVKGKPKDLKESFEYLDKMFDDTTKYTYMTLPPDFVSGKLYAYGLGMWIRNNWGLWGNSDLKKFFVKNGVNHPDFISGIILSEYYNYLNHIPFEITREVDSTLLEMSEKELTEFMESKMTKSIDLLKYYPVNDTIVIYVSASEKRFLKKENVSIRASAKVLRHENNELIVELLKIPLSRKQTTIYKIGQEINEDPYWCELIPPENWKWK